MTYLEAINSVLRLLREDEVVASNASDYGKQIGEFVNQAINECEHAFDWSVLIDTITVTTAAATATYQFHNADTKIIKATNDDKDWYMRVIPHDLQHRHDYTINLEAGSPYFYSFEGKTGDYSQIKLTPTPTGVESIRFMCVKMTPAYALDGTDDSESIKIPTLPVVLNAYARAVLERGEDAGFSYSDAVMQANNALADAVALDMTKSHISEQSWQAV